MVNTTLVESGPCQLGRKTSIYMKAWKCHFRHEFSEEFDDNSEIISELIAEVIHDEQKHS